MVVHSKLLGWHHWMQCWKELLMIGSREPVRPGSATDSGKKTISQTCCAWYHLQTFLYAVLSAWNIYSFITKFLLSAFCKPGTRPGPQNFLIAAWAQPFSVIEKFPSYWWGNWGWRGDTTGPRSQSLRVEKPQIKVGLYESSPCTEACGALAPSFLLYLINSCSSSKVQRKGCHLIEALLDPW